MRTPSVLRPRVVRYASRGPFTAPAANCWNFTCSARAASGITSAPPITSEWPPMYFVVECTTTSAPRAIGDCRYGVAKVLSTTSRAPCAWAASATAATSEIFIIGLDGVSSHTMTGPVAAARSTAAATCSASPMSTTTCSTPHGASTREMRR